MTASSKIILTSSFDYVTNVEIFVIVQRYVVPGFKGTLMQV